MNINLLKGNFSNADLEAIEDVLLNIINAHLIKEMPSYDIDIDLISGAYGEIEHKIESYADAIDLIKQWIIENEPPLEVDDYASGIPFGMFGIGD